MKHLSKYFYILCALCVVFSACEMKWDKNGDLDGMWQLTHWLQTKSGNVIKTNQDEYYISFQQDLIKMAKRTDGGYYLSHFAKRNDSIIISQPIYWPEEELRPMSELAKYGVPAHGRLHIDMLNSDHMVLSSDTAVITFRKY